MEIPFEETSKNPDELLVRRAIGRDRAAFTTLYQKYVDQIYRHTYYRVGNQEDAEDITEEVFIRAWKAIDRFNKTGAPFVSWLITISRNLIIDHYRVKKIHVSLEKMEIAADSRSNPEELAEVKFNEEYIRGAIEKLKEEKRQVIMLRFIDGFSYAEIAGMLKKSEGAVRVIQYRALSDLKRILEHK